MWLYAAWKGRTDRGRLRGTGFVRVLVTEGRMGHQEEPEGSQ